MEKKDKKEFNPSALSDLLMKAKNGRTITQFAQDAGITYQYMSALINCKRNNPPTLKTLNRISAVSADRVSFSELCEICGYDQTGVFEEADPVSNSGTPQISVTRDAVNALVLLYFDKVKVRRTEDFIAPPGIELIQCDYSAGVDYIPFRYWLFFTLTQNNVEAGSYRKYIWERYGALATTGIDEKYIITFICFDEAAFDELKSLKPIVLPLNITALSVNLNEFRIEHSELLSRATSTDESSLKKLLF